MIDHLIYYYKLGTEPFRSLSALPDEEAIKIIRGLCDDTPFGERFKDPIQYMRNRRQTEQWVRDEFIAKGGQPHTSYPIPMVLGASKWMVRNAPDPVVHGEMRIPLALFSESEILFIVESKGLPEGEWKTNLPNDLAPYIGAQVWNHEPLMEYKS